MYEIVCLKILEMAILETQMFKVSEGACPQPPQKAHTFGACCVPPF